MTRFPDGSEQGDHTLADAQLEDCRQRLAQLEAQLQTAHVYLGFTLNLVKRTGGFVSPEDQAMLRGARHFSCGEP